MSLSFRPLVEDWERTLQRNFSGPERMFLDSLMQPLPGQKGKGKAAIFRFRERSDGEDLQLEIPQPTRYLECDKGFKHQIDDIKQTPRPTLIILEDLGVDWIETLVTELEVPLHFFAQHWAPPVFHNDRKVRVPLGQDPQYHFVLNYDQVHAVQIDGEIDKGSQITLTACHYNAVFEIRKWTTAKAYEKT
jgi:hypothetical protein